SAAVLPRSFVSASTTKSQVRRDAAPRCASRAPFERQSYDPRRALIDLARNTTMFYAWRRGHDAFVAFGHAFIRQPLRPRPTVAAFWTPELRFRIDRECLVLPLDSDGELGRFFIHALDRAGNGVLGNFELLFVPSSDSLEAQSGIATPK